MDWGFVLEHSVSAAVGALVGIWLTVRGTFGKVDATLPPPQRDVVDELAPRTGQRRAPHAVVPPPVQGPAYESYRAISKPEPGVPEINLVAIVPKLGMPELRTNYGGNFCMHGEEIRREEQFIFVPITNAAQGSGLVICERHAGEVAEHAESLDDPADV